MPSLITNPYLQPLENNYRKSKLPSNKWLENAN